MENASKALLIAGEVLISIIIVSALILMFNSLTSYQGVKEQNEKEAEVIEFNTKYEAYKKNDIRGNDLYTLINKVVDYNKRKSTEGTRENEEGQYYNYSPIEIKVSFDGKKQNLTAPDGKLRIFTSSSEDFTINSTDNKFDSLFKDIRSMEGKYPSGTLLNLTSGLTKIFISSDEFNNLDINQKKEIFYNFNSAYGSEYFEDVNSKDNKNLLIVWNKYLKEGSEIRENVYKYYEYLQFTRAHFDCTKLTYNLETGRVNYMEFKFNGKIN